MMDSERIEIGDRVAVHFRSSIFYGQVLHLPSATGDCWIIKEYTTIADVLHYVQSFDQIILERKYVAKL